MSSVWRSRWYACRPRLGYDVLFSDIDVVLLSDPVPAFFPDPGKYSHVNLVQPRADYLHQQNICGWHPGKWSKTNDGEGNTGLYFMRSSNVTINFIDAALRRCQDHPELDDQTALFDELRLWRSQQRVVTCTGKKDDKVSINAFAWPEKLQPSVRTCFTRFDHCFAQRKLRTFSYRDVGKQLSAFNLRAQVEIFVERGT